MKQYLNPELPVQFINFVFNLTLVLQFFFTICCFIRFALLNEALWLQRRWILSGCRVLSNLGPCSLQGKGNEGTETFQDIPGTTLEELLRSFSRPQHCIALLPCFCRRLLPCEQLARLERIDGYKCEKCRQQRSQAQAEQAAQAPRISSAGRGVCEAHTSNGHRTTSCFTSTGARPQLPSVWPESQASKRFFSGFQPIRQDQSCRAVRSSEAASPQNGRSAWKCRYASVATPKKRCCTHAAEGIGAWGATLIFNLQWGRQSFERQCHGDSDGFFLVF